MGAEMQCLFVALTALRCHPMLYLPDHIKAGLCAPRNIRLAEWWNLKNQFCLSSWLCKGAGVSNAFQQCWFQSSEHPVHHELCRWTWL